MRGARISATVVLFASACVPGVVGCAASCSNVAYDVDTNVPGASSPAAALVAWRDEGHPDISSPPSKGWSDPATEGKKTVTLTNKQDAWVVDVLRTTSGGWVVSAAARGC